MVILTFIYITHVTNMVLQVSFFSFSLFLSFTFSLFIFSLFIFSFLLFLSVFSFLSFVLTFCSFFSFFLFFFKIITGLDGRYQLHVMDKRDFIVVELTDDPKHGHSMLERQYIFGYEKGKRTF